jgi:hypothetical protein
MSVLDEVHLHLQAEVWHVMRVGGTHGDPGSLGFVIEDAQSA